jgi:HD-GYP domain-containing protein (c-di-GMP phosphodiesterase class II)
MRRTGVVELSVLVAERMGLDRDERRKVEVAAVMRDVGKVAIPRKILDKPGPLTDEEWTVMRTHPIHAQEFLHRAGGTLREVALIVRAVQERWDGFGYPDGISGPTIPLAARIVSCANAFTAMTSERPYEPAMSRLEALRELVDNAGRQFDPHVVQTLMAVTSGPGAIGLPELARNPERLLAAAR